MAKGDAINYSLVNTTVFFGTLGSLLFGYSISCLNCIISSVVVYFEWCGNGWETDCPEANRKTGLIVNAVFIGAILGSLIGGPLVSYGRLFAHKVANVFFAIAALLFVFANSEIGLIVARILSGLATGFVMVVAPMYVAEIAPSKDRGFYVTMHQLMVTLGILVGMLGGFGLSPPTGNSDFELSGWSIIWIKLMAGLQLVPAGAQFIYFTLFPLESPMWLVSKKMPERALEVLKKIYPEGQAEAELNEIIAANEAQLAKSANAVGVLEAFTSPNYRRVAILGTAIAMFQQLTGINVFMAQCTRIFADVGIPADKQTLASAGVGVLNVVMTIPSALLVDKLGRKTILLFGGLGQTLCLGSVVLITMVAEGPIVQWVTFVAVLGFVCCFAVGFGPVTFLYLNEIYPTEMKEAACGFAFALNWAVSFVLGYAATVLGTTASFTVFTLFGILSVFIVAMFATETKGARLGESAPLAQNERTRV
eukprot:GHVN01069857.1.p1 GENE.GHVN01069857.1~~GHVN01069857.1.p1  ORF type:complete len:498 (-),score=30.37 GHVN01069857.1:218-1654(-)